MPKGIGEAGSRVISVQQIGVGVVLQRVGAWIDDVAGVEVLVGKAAGVGRLRKRLAQRVGGMHQRVDVVLLGGGAGSAQLRSESGPTLGRMKMKPARRCVPKPA